jgi:hypothetical protein
MAEWNFMDYDSKDNLLRTIREEAATMLALASEPGVWEQPTGAGHWQVRDIIGHLVDTTEGYFKSFDAARGNGPAPEALGVRGMDKHVDAAAQQFRGTPQGELIDRLQTDTSKMIDIFDALTEDEWGGLLAPHGYMGPLPAFFYPIFQLVDYAFTTGTSGRAGASTTASPATRPTCSCRSTSSSGALSTTAHPTPNRSRSASA